MLWISFHSQSVPQIHGRSAATVAVRLIVQVAVFSTDHCSGPISQDLPRGHDEALVLHGPIFNFRLGKSDKIENGLGGLHEGKLELQYW